MTKHDLINAVAEMIDHIGYEPFIWQQNVFNIEYDIIQVNPFGIWIHIMKGTKIAVGVKFNSTNNLIDGGIILDLADPTTTEQRLKEVIIKYIYN